LPAPATHITTCTFAAARVWLVRQAGNALASSSCRRMTVESAIRMSRN